MPTESAKRNTRSLATEVQHALNESCKAIYEGMAEDYERHQLEDCGYRTPETVAGQIAHYVDGPVDVLDVGAGTGMVGDALLRRGVDARLAGVDLVEPMLRAIECPAYTQCVVADAVNALPVRSASFDAAVSAGMMEHVIAPERFLPEMVRVVKPGGIAVLTFVPNRKGQTELFDRNGGLLSHDSLHIQAIVERLPCEIADRNTFDAYRNGPAWVQHESLTIVRQ